MPAGRLSFSSRGAAAAIALAAIGLSGCASQLALAPALAPPPELRTATAGPEDDVPGPVPARTVAATPQFVPVSDPGPAADMTRTAGADAAQSQWCRYLRETAAADALVLRAPTANGEIDDSGKSSLSISMSYAGLRKAQLTEQSAEAKCRRYLAENGLQKQLFFTMQELTAAGYAAKAAAIKSRHVELEKLRSRIRRELHAGAITADRATAMIVTIEQIYAAEGQASSAAGRHLTASDAPMLRPGLDGELIRAEQEMQKIDSQMRTADAFDVSVEASYRDGRMSDGLDTLPEGFTGKLKFSVKLGAFAPQRYDHEAAAADARMAALRSEDSGPLWQARMLRETQLRAIDGLNQSLAKLDAAIAKAQSLIKTIASVSQPDLAGADIEARLQIIQLQTDRAGVAGSIADIRQKTSRLPSG